MIFKGLNITPGRVSGKTINVGPRSALLKGIYSGIDVATINDFDARSFIQYIINVAGGTLSNRQIRAICTLVSDAKAHGWWTKMDVIYPMVGLTGATQAVNLKNPGGSNDITWNGNITFNELGAVGVSGSAHYGNTNWNTSTATNFQQNDCGAYCYVNKITTNTVACLGVQNAVPQGTAIFPSYSGALGFVSTAQATISTSLSSVNLLGGFFSTIRTVSTSYSQYKDGLIRGSLTATSTSRVNLNMYVLGRNANGTAVSSLHRCCFFAFGAAIGVNQMDIAADVEKFQISMNRSFFN